MEPFIRFKSNTTGGNLWIYILLLGTERDIITEEVRRLVFERFDFLPNEITTKTVLFRLQNSGYIEKTKFQGNDAYKTTDKGKQELEKMKRFAQELLAKF